MTTMAMASQTTKKTTASYDCRMTSLCKPACRDDNAETGSPGAIQSPGEPPQSEIEQGRLARRAQFGHTGQPVERTLHATL